MKLRIGSLLLAVTLLLSMVGFSVSAEPDPTEATVETVPEVTTAESGLMTVSDDAVTLLKLEEGFSRTPYWDYAQWTVGYGTACPEDRREYYMEHGITEQEAEQLLREHIAKFEAELHGFMQRTGVELNQHQFDALLLFTYNCGGSWSYEKTGRLYNAIVSGATGSKLIDAFSRWCNAGGQVKTFLLRRRLCEANIYLNGVYSQTPPQNFGYVIYDACGGTSKPNVQGYEVNETAQIIPTPTYEGYTFDGWYTARVGGTKVTVLDASTRNARLYAHWTTAGDDDAFQDPDDGVLVTVTGSWVNLRQGPGTSYPIVGKAYQGEQFIITETADAEGYTWGKFNGGWICLDYTDFDREEPEAPTEPEPTDPPATEPETPQTRMGTVSVSDSLRVRSGPSTGHEVVAYLTNGTRVEILEEKAVGAMVWGRIDKGWISMLYVVLDREEEPTEPAPTDPPETEPTVPPTTEPEQTVPTPEAWTGTVNVKDFLRVRSGPSTTAQIVGYLYPGDKVTITEKKVTDAMTWGKIDKGWISLDYIILDAAEEDKPVTGTVKVNDLLRVRSGPGSSYAIAGYLTSGTRVEILEQKTVSGTTWGRIEKGWISMDYVVLDEPVQEPEAVIRTVIADCLRIRSDASTSATIVGYLYAGAKVEILETKTVNGVQWGRVAKGWISMEYVQ